MKIAKKTTWFVIAVVFFVLTDRLLKALCLKGFFDQPVGIVGDWLSLNYAKNYGIAFSLPVGGPLLTIGTAIVILALLIYWVKLYIRTSKDKLPETGLFPLTILIVGAILNLLDRLKFGFVIDYFDLKWFTVFNLADIMIVFSVSIIFFQSIKYASRTSS